MMVYTVTVEVDPTIEDEFIQWLTPHVSDVVNTGCFTSATIERIIDPPFAAITIQARYLFETLKDFKRYEAEFAEALRGDAGERFKDKVKISRMISDHVNTVTASDPKAE